MKELQNSEKLYDRYADAVTALVMDRYVSALAEALAAEDRASAEISAALDQKCRKIIKKGCARQLRRSFGKKLLRGASVAVIAFLLLCGVFAILFTTVEAIRAPIVNFFVEQEERVPEITGKDQKEYDRSEDVLAGLAPEGYEPVECKRSSDGDLTIRYTDDGDGMISYDEFVLENGTYSNDTEDAATEDIKIGGRDALLVEKDGYQVIWYSASGEVLYQLEGNQLNREVIIAIAEAIESSRGETPPADSDLAEQTAPERRPAVSDYIITMPSKGKLHVDLDQIDINSVDIKDVVSGNITYPGLDATLIETGTQFDWSGAGGQQTENDPAGGTDTP